VLGREAINKIISLAARLPSNEKILVIEDSEVRIRHPPPATAIARVAKRRQFCTARGEVLIAVGGQARCDAATGRGRARWIARLLASAGIEELYCRGAAKHLGRAAAACSTIRTAAALTTATEGTRTRYAPAASSSCCATAAPSGGLGELGLVPQLGNDDVLSLTPAP
jgi:hypothetical protein